MRQSSGDLFPTDQPIPASQMIGRRDDIDEVATALEGGTNLVLAGPRRTGKTSVCDAALTRARSHGLYTASVDLFRLADAAELAEALATAVLANRSAVHKLLAAARRVGRGALSASQMTAVMTLQQQLGDGVELAFTPGLAARDPQKALVDALELPERVARADGKRCVVFFDEFQEIANHRGPYGNPDALTKRMRAIFQRSSQVSYLFAGSLEHVMRDLFAPSDRAFSGFGSFKRLRPIAPDEWSAGLRERFAHDDCEIGDDALARLVALGGGHPRVTMLVAQQAHLLSIRLETRTIDEVIVRQAYESALDGDRAYLDQLLGTVRSINRHALRYVRRVAAGGPLTKGMPPGDATRASRGLVAAGIVERVGHGSYEIVNPLFREYLLREQLPQIGHS
jgi:hypothetical protein